MKQKLLLFLNENYGYIKTKDLIQLGFTKYQIHTLIQSKIIKKVSHGLYMDASLQEDELYIYQLKYPNIIYSYNTAFFLHNVTERIPNVYDISVPRGKRINSIYEFHIHQLIAKKYQLGITKTLSPFGNPVKVYNLERCICDIVKNPSEIEPELSTKIITYCFKNSKLNLDLLMEYAKVFNIYNEIKTLIGAIAK